MAEQWPPAADAIEIRIEDIAQLANPLHTAEDGKPSSATALTLSGIPPEARQRSSSLAAFAPTGEAYPGELAWFIGIPARAALSYRLSYRFEVLLRLDK
jgi:hypothetical protein